ncbi:MAG: LacI family DNA-binding transcriptional regulator [Mycobacterium sp.]
MTSRDVAKLAGVSQATVSRVLSGSSTVRSETRERVTTALETLNYRPNSAARSMRTRRSGAIGVVVSNLTNPVYPEIVTAVSEKLRQTSHRMVLWDSDRSGIAAADAISEGVVDGLIFTTATPSTAQDGSALRAALERRAPIVLVTRGLADLDCDQVTGNDFHGGFEVVDYLAHHGHSRLGFIGGPREASTAANREAGFWAGIEAHGIDTQSVASCRGDFSYDDGQRGLRELVAKSPRPTAVFCVNDLMAFGAIDACRQLDLRVPADVWVVGYNDIAIASWGAYDLTTQRQPLSDMASKAVDLVLERVAHPRLPSRICRFPSQLVVRGSTANAAWEDKTPD